MNINFEYIEATAMTNVSRRSRTELQLYYGWPGSGPLSNASG